MPRKNQSSFLAGWSYGGVGWLLWWIILVCLIVFWVQPWRKVVDGLGLLVLLACPGTLGMWLMWYFGQMRSRAVARLGDELGLRYTRKLLRGRAAELSGLPLFRDNQIPEGIRVLRGTFDGFEVVIMDYHWFIDMGPISEPKKGCLQQTVVIVLDAGEEIPDFVLMPASGKGPFWNLGYKNVDFGQQRCPEFAKRFMIDGDPKSLKRFFSPDKLRWLAQMGGGSLAVSQGRLLLPFGLRQRVKKWPELLNLAVTTARVLRGEGRATA